MTEPAHRERLVAGVWLILAVGAVVGVANNGLSAHRIPWFQEWSSYVTTEAEKKGLHLVDLEAVRQIAASGSHIILDARPARDFDAGHIPGAFSAPYEAAADALGPLAGVLTPEQAILVYCSGQQCDESLLLAGTLRGMGLTNLYLFAGGYREWAGAGGAGR
jgi:rhodanese-related sulfurtransferase